MIILTLRTDKPEAEIGLYDDHKRLAYDIWTAHRRLAETIHTHITDLLQQNDLAWKDIKGLVVYKGPGSFTGLRIGISTANAVAYGLDVPLVAASGEDWLDTGIDKVLGGQNDHVAMPDYGSPVHITAPQK